MKKILLQNKARTSHIFVPLLGSRSLTGPNFCRHGKHQYLMRDSYPFYVKEEQRIVGSLKGISMFQLF